jgi:NAD+ kinase
MKILLIYNSQKEITKNSVSEVRDFLNGSGEEVIGVFSNDYIIQHGIDHIDFDMVVVLGGDGTLLGQARKLLEFARPLIGINFGGVGFLAEFDLKEFQDYWKEISQGKHKVVERELIFVKIERIKESKRETIFSSYAANDVVITSGPPFRMIEVSVYINPDKYKFPAATFKSDGVMASTSLGSTAYNLSAGGPIIHPKAKVFCVTPICPHSISARPIVVCSSDIIEFRVLQSNEGTSVVVDGQEIFSLKQDDIINITKAKHKLKIVLNPNKNYWDILRSKMNWAYRPK